MNNSLVATWKNKVQTIRWSIVVLVIGMAGAVGFLTARDRITVKIGVTLAAAVAAFYVLLQGRRSYWALLCIGIATIAIGHHGIYTDARTYFVPLSIVFFALCGVLIVDSILRGQPLGVRLPIALIFLTTWAVFHAGATLVTFQPSLTGDNTDELVVIAWVTTFIIGFPAFFVIGKLVVTEARMIWLLKIMMISTAVMSILGILEYYVPAVTRLLPGLFTKSSFIAQDGFDRAQFSFWGYPAAAAIISWGMFVAFDQLSNSKALKSTLFALAIFVIDGIAIFISGQRSSWIALVLGLIILNLRLKSRTVVITLIFIAGAIIILPPEFWNRVATITSIAVKGQVVDTSSQARLDKWQAGLNMIIQNPLTGSGYADVLVHDSVLEIGSRLGLIPAIVFLVFLGQLVFRIVQCYRLPSPTAKRYGLLFMALAVPWLIQMAVEADLQVQPFAAAQWAFLALGWYALDVFRPQPTSDQLFTGNLIEEL